MFKSKSVPQLACILLIEDSPVDQKLITSFLEREGFKVIIAGEGNLGFEMAQKKIPDLIILDYNLPDTIGPEICRKIKKDPITKNIPVLFLTCEDSPGSIIKMYSEQPEYYLTKPINSRFLVKQVKLLLQEAGVKV